MARPAMRSASELLGLALAGVVPCLAYAALGLWMLRALRLPASGAERVALAFVLGSGAASLALLILLGFGAPVPLPALALVALAGVPALRTPPPDPTPASPAPRWSRWIDGATLALGLLIFLAALGPETYWDGFEYHLPIAKAWADGGIRALPGVLDAELRAGIDLLYVPALAAGEPDAAASVSACFALALAGLVRAEARRRASPGAGSLAAFFALVVPLTLENAPSSYVDLGAGAYGFLALLFADRWNRTGDARLIGATALCLAFAANAKLHLAVLVPAVLVLVLLGGRPPRAREIAVGAALVVALVTPWCVKEALTTGNPFFPFLGGRFGLGGYDARHLALRAVRLSTDFAQPRTAGTTLAYLASLVAGRNPHLSGLLGPLPFALAPLALRRPSRARVGSPRRRWRSAWACSRSTIWPASPRRACRASPRCAIHGPTRVACFPIRPRFATQCRGPSRWSRFPREPWRGWSGPSTSSTGSATASSSSIASCSTRPRPKQPWRCSCGAACTRSCSTWRRLSRPTERSAIPASMPGSETAERACALIHSRSPRAEAASG